MRHPRSLGQVHAATILFGLAGLFGKWLDLSPFLIVLGRVVFASAALALLIGLSRGRFTVKTKADWGLFVFQGVLLAVHWVVFFQAIRVSTVAVGLLSYSSFPVFTAFLEPVFFRAKLDGFNLGLSFVCLAGVFFIVPRFAWSDAVFQGVLFGLAAGATFALLSIVNRKLSFRYSSPVIAFYQDVFAALGLLPVLFLLPFALRGRDILLLAILGVVCTAGAHTLFIGGMRRLTAQTASIISALEPVYGIVFALLFLGEHPAGRTLFGGAVILAAVVAISLRSLNDRRPESLCPPQITEQIR